MIEVYIACGSTNSWPYCWLEYRYQPSAISMIQPKQESLVLVKETKERSQQRNEKNRENQEKETSFPSQLHSLERDHSAAALGSRPPRPLVKGGADGQTQHHTAALQHPTRASQQLVRFTAPWDSAPHLGPSSPLGCLVTRIETRTPSRTSPTARAYGARDSGPRGLYELPRMK